MLLSLPRYNGEEIEKPGPIFDEDNRYMYRLIELLSF